MATLSDSLQAFLAAEDTYKVYDYIFEDGYALH